MKPWTMERKAEANQMQDSDAAQKMISTKKMEEEIEEQKAHFEDTTRQLTMEKD